MAVVDDETVRYVGVEPFNFEVVNRTSQGEFRIVSFENLNTVHPSPRKHASRFASSARRAPVWLGPSASTAIFNVGCPASTLYDGGNPEPFGCFVGMTNCATNPLLASRAISIVSGSGTAAPLPPRTLGACPIAFNVAAIFARVASSRMGLFARIRSEACSRFVAAIVTDETR